MTLVGQHARSGSNVSDNSSEGVKNGNVDKIKWHSKFQVSNIFLDFEKKLRTWSRPKFNFGGLHVFGSFRRVLRDVVATSCMLPYECHTYLKSL